MTIKEIEQAIDYLEKKINKQGIIKNERDLNHLDNLQQLYISKLVKIDR
jgi:non-ribosomal peptide synthetase component E (peptide arylation enzyme)|tara:strand:+ start:1109 stop:1255 length:147 start_codon:yes stop_codon:yes gene_type:complete